MAARTKIKRPARPARELREWTASAPSGSPLTVDRDAGVIFGVKVLGAHSRNNHGLREATDGTEYTRRCMESALPMYEGVDVLVNHRLKTGPAARGTDDVFGQLRNCTLGADGIRADLHYLKSHAMAERVCEDVERGLGVFGLSHDASAARERFDRASRRLVIESLAVVRSVDLVRKPATNRNLWESLVDKTTTLRELLEDLTLTPARRKWRTRLLEDDVMAPTLDAPIDAPADSSDPDDALWTGFKAALDKLFEQYKDGTLDAKAVGKQVVEYLKAHDKLTGDSEPEAPAADEGASTDTDSDPDKTEAAKDELAATKHKLAVRELCEELNVRPDKTLLESLEHMPLDKGRKLVEREKVRGGAPKSGGGHNGTRPAKPARGQGFLDRVTT